MKSKRVIEGIAVVVLIGIALEAAHAETVSNGPAVGTQAASPSGVPSEAKSELPVSDATPVSANADSAAASQKTDSDAPAAAEGAEAKPSILQRAMNGVSALYERAKAFISPSDK